MNTRIFALLSNATIVSIGLFDTSSPTIAEDIQRTTTEKIGDVGAILLDEAAVYRIIETGREALNTP